VGDSFIKMDHGHLEDMFGRRQRPDINVRFSYKELETSPDLHKYQFFVEFINEGRVMCNYYGFDLIFPSESFLEIREQGRPDGSAPRPAFTGRYLKEEVSKYSDMIKISFRNASDEPPLFPGEKKQITRAGRFTYKVNQNIREYYNNSELLAHVYGDNSPMKTFTIKFSEINCF